MIGDEVIDVILDRFNEHLKELDKRIGVKKEKQGLQSSETIILTIFLKWFFSQIMEDKP